MPTKIMSDSGRRYFSSAMLGFAVTAAFVSYQLLTDVQSPLSRNPGMMMLFLVLCPPSLLSIVFRSVEVGSNAFYFIWIIIGVLNGALYASLRALLGNRLRRPD
jgi:hypothetical protein